MLANDGSLVLFLPFPSLDISYFKGATLPVFVLILPTPVLGQG